MLRQWLGAKISDYWWWFFTKEASCYRTIWDLTLLGYNKQSADYMFKMYRIIHKTSWRWDDPEITESIGISHIKLKNTTSINASNIPHLIDIGMFKEN